jgi:phage-related protein
MYQIRYLVDVDKYIDQSIQSDQRKIVKNLKYLNEYGLRSEFRDAKKLRGFDFWEVRILGIQRSNVVYILHIFQKKSNKTNKRDLAYGIRQLLRID